MGERKDSRRWRLMLMLIELMCLNNSDDETVITQSERVKSLLWKRCDLFTVHAFSQFSAFTQIFKIIFFLCARHIFQFWFPHCRDMSAVYIFPSLTKMFMASMSIDLFILMMWNFIAFFFFPYFFSSLDAFFGSATVFSIWKPYATHLKLARYVSNFWNIFQYIFIKHLRFERAQMFLAIATSTGKAVNNFNPQIFWLIKINLH